MKHYEPPIPFSESDAAKVKWSELVYPVFGEVKVAWENVRIDTDGYAEVIMIAPSGEVIVGSWEYSVIDDIWDTAEPDDIVMAFRDGFNVAVPELMVQYVALIRQISPADPQNLALEEVLDYLASLKEKDCD